MKGGRGRKQEARRKQDYDEPKREEKENTADEKNIRNEGIITERTEPKEEKEDDIVGKIKL